MIQFSSAERKREVVSDLEEHLSELRKVVEQLKQNVDSAADDKYDTSVSYTLGHFIFCSKTKV